jgi:hypothetical protein
MKTELNKKVVLCLEDTESRIRWLRGICDSYGCTLHSTPLVCEFLLLCQRHVSSDVKAIVLDHDLGGYSMPVSLQDPDGLDGIDAVEQMLVLTAPVLIWSSNDVESPRMERLLGERGYTEVSRQAWYGDRDEIAATLRSWLSRAGV